jgi:hypothetical protein
MQKLRGIVEKERLLITMPWGIGDAIRHNAPSDQSVSR